MLRRQLFNDEMVYDACVTLLVSIRRNRYPLTGVLPRVRSCKKESQAVSGIDMDDMARIRERLVMFDFERTRKEARTA